MKMQDAKNVAEFVQGFLDENEIAQTELARQVGCTKQYMNRVVKGEFDRPMTVLAKLVPQLKDAEKQKLVLLLAQSLLNELARGGR